jgi:high-affinity iron transporter
MWQGFTIALREGLESFLIVALTLAYLRKTGRARLAKAVVLGVLVSIAVSTGAGLLLGRAANQPLWEGILALVAVVLVGSLLVYMLKAARTMKTDLEKRLDRAAAGFGGVFFFTVLMITREGMETALLVTTALFQMKQAPLVLGLVLGVAAAAAVGFTWTRLGRGVNVGVLLRVSAVFLTVFLLQLALYTVHELAEANVLPNARAIHDATEILGPDGRIGAALTWLLALVPTAWLVGAWAKGARLSHPAR